MIMKKKTVNLKYSIPVPKEGGGSVNINELSLGRLKAKHLRLLPKNFMEDEGKINPADVIPLIAGLAEIPVESAEEIDIEDLMEVADSLQGFLGESLETGKK
jgi:hypothetical protein